MEFPFDGNGNVMTVDALVCSCAPMMRIAIVAAMPTILMDIANRTLAFRDGERFAQ